MNNSITLFEDNKNHYLLPLSYFKHFSQLKVGCLSIKEKWEKRGFNVKLSGRNYLVNNADVQNKLWVSARILITKELVNKLNEIPNDSYLTYKSYVIAINTDAEIKLDEQGFLDESCLDNLNEIKLDNINILEYPWDIMSHNHNELIEDLGYFEYEARETPSIYTLNKTNIFVHPSAQIQPGVVINAEKAPVVIGKDVKIGANSYLEGPLFLAEKTEVRAFTSVKDSSIHFNCRIGGEISGSVMLEYSNKVHHGFLGNSVLGSWTNLGAGTTNSNLKNNYSNVSMMYFNEVIHLDTQFMGLIFGDHSKSAINSTFNTATVIGVNTNIFGGGIPSKLVPSFIWGGIDSFKKYELSKAKEVAKAVMSRRDVEFDEIQSNLFDAVHKHVLKVEY